MTSRAVEGGGLNKKGVGKRMCDAAGPATMTSRAGAYQKYRRGRRYRGELFLPFAFCGWGEDGRRRSGGAFVFTLSFTLPFFAGTFLVAFAFACAFVEVS